MKTDKLINRLGAALRASAAAVEIGSGLRLLKAGKPDKAKEALAAGLEQFAGAIRALNANGEPKP